jgi:hypothetical protein
MHGKRRGLNLWVGGIISVIFLGVVGILAYRTLAEKRVGAPMIAPGNQSPLHTPEAANTSIPERQTPLPFPSKTMPEPRELLKGNDWSSQYEAARQKLSALEHEKDMPPVFSLRITNVIPRSQADKKGMKQGDCIVTFDGEPVRGASAVSYQRKNGATRVGVWSPGGKSRILDFEPGMMGVSYMDYWRPELAYLRGAERDKAWDDLLLVAALAFETNPPLAETALHHARKAGYRGWLLPALMTVISGESSRPDLAVAYGYPIRSTVPEHSQKTVLFYLCCAAVQEGRIEVARELTEKYPQYHLDYIDLEAALERNKSLSLAELAAISSSSEPLRKIETDLTSKAECSDWAMRYIRNRQAFPVSAPGTRYAVVEVGPGIENPAIIVDVAFRNLGQTREELPPYFELDLIDTSCGEDDLASVSWDTKGALAWKINGYASGNENVQQLLIPNGWDRAEIYLNGSLCEIWFNGQRQAIGVLPREKRKVIGLLYFRGIMASVQKVTFAELSPVSPTSALSASSPGAGAGSATSRELRAPERPADPSQAWFYDMTVGAYLAHGHRNPTWDSDAVQAAWLAGQWWAGESPVVEPDVILAKTKAAISNGCDDPLVFLIHGEMLEMLEGDTSQPVRFLCQAAAGMKNSTYPAFLRFTALTRSYALFMYSRLNTVRQRSLEDAEAAAALLQDVLSDPNVSKFSLRRLLLQYVLPSSCSSNPNEPCAGYELYYAALAKADREGSVAQTIKGAYYTEYAWMARGSDWASKVTPEGWKLFGERLKVAADCLLDAIRLDPTNAEAMEWMIVVCKGQGRPREELDKYLQAAVRANPIGTEAYINALEYLRPRWHGTPQEMIELTDQCLQRMRNDPKATPWLVNIRTQMHCCFADDLYQSTQDHNEGTALQMMYWTLPEVWKDIEQAYELALTRSPNSRFLKSYYASWAVKCEQWAAADRLLTELGDGAAPYPFGGLSDLRWARLKARAMTAAINGTVK